MRYAITALVCLFFASFAIAADPTAGQHFIQNRKANGVGFEFNSWTWTAGTLLGRYANGTVGPVAIGSNLTLTAGGTLNATGGGGSGTVTSVAVSGSDGIEIDSGSPITTSGTIALGVNAAALSSHLGLGALATLSAVTSATITDGTIVNADISTSAAIALSKLADSGTFALGATGQIAFETTALILSSAGITAEGDITANTLGGNGSAITTLNASNLSSGTVAAARMPALTGDVTTTAGGVATTIATGAVGPTQLASTAVTAGSYTNANVTVDADGRLTAASNGSGGGATLGANTFTALQTITQASANTGVLASTGYSLTGTSAANMIDLAGTWNTTGIATALKINITNTASALTSNLIDLQSSGTSRFAVAADSNTGWTANGNTIFVPNMGGASRLKMCGLYGFFFNPNDSFTLPSAALIGWCSSSTGPGNVGSDTDLQRVSAGILKLRNGTTTSPAYFQVWGNSTGSKYISVGHDGTDGVISASSGVVRVTTGGLTVGTNGTNTTLVKHGTATLVAGTVTVSDSDVVAGSRIFVNRQTDGGTLGDSYSVAITAATNFVIQSKTANANVAGDTSTVSWIMVNP